MVLRPLAHLLRDRARAAAGPSALVLTYHRVTDLERDPQLLAVAPTNFENQIAALSAAHRVVSLARLVEELRGGHIVDGTVAVTFDDGYVDNLVNARPVLEAHDVPGTVFVSSGYLGGEREFWWDELERTVLSTDTDAAWNVLLPPSNDRQRAYIDLDRQVHGLSADEREHVLESARSRFGVAAGTRDSHRVMTGEEVTALDSSPSIEVGAHSRDHVVLAKLSAVEQRLSIEDDKRALEGLCGREMRLFSYPYGGRGDYTAQTVEVVRRAGFIGACANFPGLVKRWTDPYQIPRHVVRDWSAEELLARVGAWLSGREVRP